MDIFNGILKWERANGYQLSAGDYVFYNTMNVYNDTFLQNNNQRNMPYTRGSVTWLQLV